MKDQGRNEMGIRWRRGSRVERGTKVRVEEYRDAKMGGGTTQRGDMDAEIPRLWSRALSLTGQGFPRLSGTVTGMM